MSASQRARRLIAELERRLAARQRSRPPRWVVVAVIVALGLGAMLAIESLPSDLDGFAWWPIALLVAVTLPGMALNAYEYAVSARIGGASVGFWPALRVALYGTAANLLPMPGASMVRIEAMRRSGTGLGRAAAATAAVGIAWLGVSLSMAGFLLLPRGLVAVPFLGGGLICMVVVWVVLHRRVDPRVARANLARLVVVEVCFVSVTALKLGLALLAIGAPTSPVQAFTLGVSSTIAAATGFLPGGLGLREAIAAALGPIVGLDPSTAFLAAVVDRAVALVVVAIAATVVLNIGGRADKPSQSLDPGHG